MLSDIPVETDPRVLVDFRTADDAGVYAWEAGPALVQTVDFFTPIVDDPYVYGEIAAANSLSDVYAMGGRPLTALAVAGFPEDLVDADDHRPGLQGRTRHPAARRRRAARRPHRARPRDQVRLRRDRRRLAGSRVAECRRARRRRPDPHQAIGTGIVGTAIKFGRAPSALVERAVAGMRTLNRAAAEALAAVEVHACTDVTGFGLVGHASEMASASHVSLEIDAGSVPLIEGVIDLVAQNKAGGLATNRSHFGAGVDLRASVPPALGDLLFDPQTSGGLLVAVPAAAAAGAVNRLAEAGVLAARIGVVTGGTAPLITIR